MPSSAPSTDPLDVRPDHLAIIRDILRTHVPGHPVWAFGSRVTGRASPTSDLDLAVIGDVPLDFVVLAELKDALSISSIPYKVDIVDFATITPEFRKLIRARYRVVQGDAQDRR